MCQLPCQVPRQDNAIDCGLYVLMNGEHTLRSLDAIRTISVTDLGGRPTLRRFIDEDTYTVRDVGIRRAYYKGLHDTHRAVYDAMYGKARERGDAEGSRGDDEGSSSGTRSSRGTKRGIDVTKDMDKDVPHHLRKSRSRSRRSEEACF